MVELIETAPAGAEDVVDVRLQRSRLAMIAAVDELIAEGAGLEEITITAIVRRAGVSRPTFYKQFADVAELLRASAMTRMTTMFDRVAGQVPGTSWQDFMTCTIRTLLTELVSDRPYYLTALEASPASLIEEITELITERLLHHSPLAPTLGSATGRVTARQRAGFLAAGTVWQARSWLQSLHDADVTHDQVAAAIDEEMAVLSELLMSATGTSDHGELPAVPASDQNREDR